MLNLQTHGGFGFAEEYDVEHQVPGNAAQSGRAHLLNLILSFLFRARARPSKLLRQARICVAQLLFPLRSPIGRFGGVSGTCLLRIWAPP